MQREARQWRLGEADAALGQPGADVVQPARAERDVLEGRALRRAFRRPDRLPRRQVQDRASTA